MTQEAVYASSIEAQEFEPLDLGTVLEGEPAAEVHWLRPEEGGDFCAGVFRCRPAVFEYDFESDEAIHVLEGRVSIRAGERTVELGPGGIASFRKGTRTVWTVTEPFKEFFVLGASG